MKKTSIVLAAGLLMAGVSAAGAGTESLSTSAKMSRPASDTLHLTIGQQNATWNDLQHHATEQKAPWSFQADIDATVPSTVKIEAVPRKLASDVPSLKAYDFAMVRGKLLIVNPSDKKIVAMMEDVYGS
jgi:Protein of unknown function (DUF1236)